MGRAMLNICIVFAQLERETIQKRVTDAYYSRSQRGFKMGGKASYGDITRYFAEQGILFNGKEQSLPLTLPTLRERTGVIFIKGGM